MRRVIYTLLAVSLSAGEICAEHQVAPDRLDHAIDQAALYLTRHAEADGRFVYRVHLDPHVTVTPAYNVLRHAGAIYALTQYHQLRPQENTHRVLLQAGKFLQSQIGEVGELSDVLAVWSNPDISGKDSRKAKLGGTGLGLVALTGLERIEPGLSPADKLEHLGNFLLFMQKDDGSFYSHYLPRFPGRDDSWTSLYYPGEAALGLLRLHELRPDPEWVAGAAEALTYLARSRADQPTVPADHWALLATAKLLALPRQDQQGADNELLIEHAAQICRQMISEQASQNDDPILNGCFTADGRTTPSATRLEGLLATWAFLPIDEYRDLRRDIRLACDRGVAFLLRTQVDDGPHAGGLPRALAPLPKNHPLWSPSFNRRAGEIRIDYVQHALSAWMQYRLLTR